MNTPPIKTAEEWKDRFRSILKYAERDYCPGCGLTQEGLNEIIKEAKREVMNDVQEIVDLLENNVVSREIKTILENHCILSPEKDN